MADNLYLPLDLQTKQAEMQRKQKLAQAVLGAVQAPQAQMVGGQYISPGILGQALPLIKAMMGQKLENDAASENAKFISDNAARIGTMGQPSDLITQKHLDTDSVRAYAQGGGDQSLRRAAPQVSKKYTGATRYANDNKTIQAEVQYPDGTTGWETKNAGININTGDKMFDATALKMHQKIAEEAMATRQKATANINLVKKLGEVLPKVLAGETYAGPWSDIQSGAASLVQEIFGVKLDGQAATEYLKKLGNEGVAQLIAGATGRSLTDADVQRLVTQYANQMNSPDALRLLLSDMDRMAKQGLDEYNSMRNYYQNMGDKLGETMYHFMDVPMTGTGVLETPLDPEAAQVLQPKVGNPVVPSASERNAPVDGLRLPPGVKVVK